ncbi:carboxypeptidase M32 [Poriferisphaera sp. WC338]|uniref:carboxypeptidase M32 n=1 Tax=Poriferisphaera sp. WC338 TaxID=3425129 RepID=UPI003D81802F
MNQRNAYQQLTSHWVDLSVLASTASVLSWDQEVMMPKMAASHRAKQLAQLSGMVHGRMTDERVGDWLAACEVDDGLMGDPLSEFAVNVRELRHKYDLATKLPAELVTELTEVASMAQGVWAKARQEQNFNMFKDDLERVLNLLREKAKCFGWDEKNGEAWDALAEEYEPGCRAKDVERVFEPLRDQLVRLLGKIKASGYHPDGKLNKLEIREDKQYAFVKEVVDTLGFNFEGGRLDRSAHPFCSGGGPRDARMTTRFHKDMIGDALGSTMHEAGHGMYDQGMREDMWGLPMGDYVSLGIHESQSRMWENLVGRSKAFWQWCLPVLKKHIGEAVSSIHELDCYESVNRVEASLIRVEADEVTYNLHIMIRFELERAMVSGALDVADLPDAWNEKYRDYLGVNVPHDGVGCLQDVHWSCGAMGYFPTYTLGNLYASQFFEAAEREVGDLGAKFAAGEFDMLLNWLREKIHRQGMRYRAADLCEVVTGERLSAEPLMRHLESKFGEVYHF